MAPQGCPRPDPPAPASFLLPRGVSSAGSSPPPTPRLTLSGGPFPGPPTAAPGAGSALFTKAFLPPPQVRLAFSPFLEPPGRPLGRTSVPGPPGWSAEAPVSQAARLVGGGTSVPGPPSWSADAPVPRRPGWSALHCQVLGRGFGRRGLCSRKVTRLLTFTARRRHGLCPKPCLQPPVSPASSWHGASEVQTRSSRLLLTVTPEDPLRASTEALPSSPA